MKIALTVDVEDWYQTHDFSFPPETWSSYEDRVEYSTKKLLDILEEANIRGTFFVLGCVAHKHPLLIREIRDRGHEIGSHGGWHRMVSSLSPEEFREDLVWSKKLLEGITGREIRIFRAPSWSISRETLWALEILEEEGFICDSSIQPFKTPLSGIKGAPVQPYHPVVNGRSLKLIEFPPTVLQLGWLRIPFSGGFYLRLFPRFLVKAAFKQVSRKSPGILYLHPWEFDPEQPRLKVSPLVSFVHYYNLENNHSKVKKLLRDFSFVPLGEILTEGSLKNLRTKAI